MKSKSILTVLLSALTVFVSACTTASAQPTPDSDYVVSFNNGDFNVVAESDNGGSYTFGDVLPDGVSAGEVVDILATKNAAIPYRELSVTVRGETVKVRTYEGFPQCDVAAGGKLYSEPGEDCDVTVVTSEWTVVIVRSGNEWRIAIHLPPEGVA